MRLAEAWEKVWVRLLIYGLVAATYVGILLSI